MKKTLLIALTLATAFSALAVKKPTKLNRGMNFDGHAITGVSAITNAAGVDIGATAIRADSKRIDYFMGPDGLLAPTSDGTSTTLDISGIAADTTAIEAELAATLKAGKDATLGSVTASNLTVVGGGNVITTGDVATGSETNAANKVLKLDENGKIDADAIPFVTIYFTGGRVTPEQ